MKEEIKLATDMYIALLPLSIACGNFAVKAVKRQRVFWIAAGEKRAEATGHRFDLVFQILGGAAPVIDEE